MPITFAIIGFIFSAIGGFVCCKCYDRGNRSKSKTIFQSDESGKVVVLKRTKADDVGRKKGKIGK